MSFDPWGSWRAAAAQWAPPGTPAFGGVPGAGAGALPPPSFAEFARQFQQAAQAFLGAGGATPANEAFTRFLRERFAQLRMPWSFDASGLAGGPGGSGATASGAPGGSGWALGAGREHQERLQRLGAAAARLAAAQQRLELLWSDALREAAGSYAGQLGAQAGQDFKATPEALQGLYDRWVDCAEDAYGRMAHSEAYCDAFAEYVNAGSQWRNELQAGIEQWARLLDLPTRSEINSLELRLRELEQAARRDAGAAAGVAPARRTKRRTPP